MLGILAGLRKIRIGIFQHRILIAVSELSLQSNVTRNVMIFSFGRAFCGVLILLALRHDSLARMN